MIAEHSSMKILSVIATIVGLCTDALTLIAYGRQGSISLPGKYVFQLTPTRIWMFAIVGALITGYFYSQVTGRWPFTETQDGKIPIQAVFIVGPWVLLAGFATGLFE
jgi:hypothetical protein